MYRLVARTPQTIFPHPYGMRPLTTGEGTAMPKSANKAPKPERKKPATYHTAAFDAFWYRLREYIKSGDVTLHDEHRLSREPLRIDIMVIKKNRDVEIGISWGKIFRQCNVIEYKSPVDSPPTLPVFIKVVHGYVGIYSTQNDVNISDMSATILCYQKPTELFGILKNELSYKILRKNRGVYYIIQKGGVQEKSLAVQIVVYSELDDSDLVLKALRPEIDEATARKVLELTEEEGESSASLPQWWDVMWSINENILSEEMGMNKRDRVRLAKKLKEKGVLTEILQEERQDAWQKGVQAGEQRGMVQIIEYWKKGHSVEEAEKMFALQ